MEYIGELGYLDLLRDIRDTGTFKNDRTGVGTKAIFGPQIRFNLIDSFPLLTTKKLAWKPIVSEQLWFIEGSGDERRLAEILYGKDRSELTEKTTIWTANAQADYWKPKAQFEGDLGRVYGTQWRNWKQYQIHDDNVISVTKIDQLANLIDGIKGDPDGRRHILMAWNPAELDQMALPPCHIMCQFFVRDGKWLSCHMYQRSVDTVLGLPFNIASYALLTYMIAQVCNLKPGELIISMGDAHIYSNHFEGIKEQLERSPFVSPKVELNKDITNIDDFKMSDIKLREYYSHDSIKFEMAV